MRFFDQTKIHVQGGHGGNGCVSFRRERRVPRGGPDGGSGGRGGDVVVMTVAGLNTLADFRYRHAYRAGKGRHGSGSHRHGAAAEPLRLEVPAGCVILAEDKQTELADLPENDMEYVLCRGGRGGCGNAALATSTHRTPRHAFEGEKGEEGWFWLRLKLAADVALIGMPNAGKSTLLSCLSRARPKVADYPFTTLRPQLGHVLHLQGEGFQEGFILADIPGLIEGAHGGAGLGDRFLGHAERCAVLLHLVDAAGRDPVAAWRVVRHEIEAYGAGLADKAEVLALSKCDSVPQRDLVRLRRRLSEAAGQPVETVAALHGQGLGKIVAALQEVLAPLRHEKLSPAQSHDAARATSVSAWTP